MSVLVQSRMTPSPDSKLHSQYVQKGVADCWWDAGRKRKMAEMMGNFDMTWANAIDSVKVSTLLLSERRRDKWMTPVTRRQWRRPRGGNWHLIIIIILLVAGAQNHKSDL